MFPQEEDDLIAQMLEIKTNGKMIVIMFYWWINCIRKVIGYYDTNKSCKVSHKSVDCYNAKWFMAYCLSLTIILDMHCWQIGIRSAPWAGSWQEIQSKARMTQERKENYWRTRTPRAVLILGGKNVMSLLYTPKHIAILNIIVWGLLGEELKCQGKLNPQGQK